MRYEMNMPSSNITPVNRSDESGTSENFGKYLAGSAADAFKLEPAKQWPGKTGEGRPKSDGVSL